MWQPMKNTWWAAIIVSAALVGASACKKTQPQAQTPAQRSSSQTTSGLQGLSLKGKRVGLSMYTLGNPYFAAQKAAVEKTVRALGGHFVATDANDELGKQISDVEDLLALGIDVLVLNPKDPKGLVEATYAARDMKVPVVVIDSGIDPSAFYVTNVQASNRENGMKVGAWVASQLKGKPVKMALLSGTQGNPVGQARREGVIAGLIEELLRTQGKADVQIVAQGWGSWNALGGLQAMEDILTAHGDINLLVSENDDMALGALEAIREVGKAQHILVAAAADGQKQAIELIQKGQYGVTGLNSPVLTAEKAVEIAARYLAGQRGFDLVTYTAPAAITRENAHAFYNPNAVF
jgi:ribose transport system substrate-binding protein